MCKSAEKIQHCVAPTLSLGWTFSFVHGRSRATSNSLNQWGFRFVLSALTFPHNLKIINIVPSYIILSIPSRVSFLDMLLETPIIIRIYQGTREGRSTQRLIKQDASGIATAGSCFAERYVCFFLLKKIPKKYICIYIYMCVCMHLHCHSGRRCLMQYNLYSRGEFSFFFLSETICDFFLPSDSPSSPSWCFFCLKREQWFCRQGKEGRGLSL